MNWYPSGAIATGRRSGRVGRIPVSHRGCAAITDIIHGIGQRLPAFSMLPKRVDLSSLVAIARISTALHDAKRGQEDADDRNHADDEDHQRYR